MFIPNHKLDFNNMYKNKLERFEDDEIEDSKREVDITVEDIE